MILLVKQNLLYRFYTWKAGIPVGSWEEHSLKTAPLGKETLQKGGDPGNTAETKSSGNSRFEGSWDF